MKERKKRTTFGLSFPDETVLEEGKQRAEELGLTFSSYVNQLIRQDLGRPGAYIAGNAPSPAKNEVNLSTKEIMDLKVKFREEAKSLTNSELIQRGRFYQKTTEISDDGSGSYVHAYDLNEKQILESGEIYDELNERGLLSQVEDSESERKTM